jgi:hypothetical protein
MLNPNFSKIIWNHSPIIALDILMGWSVNGASINQRV